jgi:hypothetical protein
MLDTLFKPSAALTEEELAFLDEVFAEQALTEEEIEFLDEAVEETVEEALADEAHPDTFHFTEDDHKAYMKDPSAYMAALAIKTSRVVKTASTAM